MGLSSSESLAASDLGLCLFSVSSCSESLAGCGFSSSSMSEVLALRFTGELPSSSSSLSAGRGGSGSESLPSPPPRASWSDPLSAFSDLLSWAASSLSLPSSCESTTIRKQRLLTLRSQMQRSLFLHQIWINVEMLSNVSSAVNGCHQNDDQTRPLFHRRKRYYGLWTHILVKNVLMMDWMCSFCLLKSLTDGLEWCGLLWCFYQLFGLILTAPIHCWDSDAVTHFSKSDEETNSSKSWTI